MPGLNQLKQFNADILTLGDEVKIRSARGEKPVTVKIPKKITVADDSADFAEGMPVVSEEEVLRPKLRPQKGSVKNITLRACLTTVPVQRRRL